jgi:hypothetical protein
VAERFFGRSNNRRGTQRDRVFEECPWGIEGQTAVFCYDCHEELLHNPVLPIWSMSDILTKTEKQNQKTKLQAG